MQRPPGAPARVFDLLSHVPAATIDRRRLVSVADAPDKEVATLTVKVSRQIPPRQRGSPTIIVASDDSGEVALVFFKGAGRWLQGAYPVGAWVRVSGLVEWRETRDGLARPQMVHPDVREVVDGPDAPPGARFRLEPVYALTQGITQGVLSSAVSAALSDLPSLPEWIAPERLAEEGWPSFGDALKRLHAPDAPSDIASNASARLRLAYDEFLATQLALAIVRDRERNTRGIARQWDPARIEALRAALPFPLTASQDGAIAEVAADLRAPHKMVRLLQGDVGSGKTMVALFAAAMVAGAGGQTAIMAPTDLVARQHFASLSALLEPEGIGVRLLTGRLSEQERARTLSELADGKAAVAVGTHALFQASVGFADLGLVVIDEQHRFGVHQRLSLSQKGLRTDLLVMTATPIPRTLVLSQYGDMDVSRLTEKPAGRQEITTRAVPLTQMDAVLSRLSDAIARGEKAYWVCPLVEESEASALTAVTDRHGALVRALGPVVGLVHGATPLPEREATMEAFRAGTLSVLVATTVVEVGVDVPDATIMVVENAESFGLSQLHQLRGRVGRGTKPSTCLLLYRPPITDTARERLATMRRTNDGFAIAEDDLRLRGEGEVLGTRQSGDAGTRFASPSHHADLLEMARSDARSTVQTDRTLTSDRGRAQRILLTLYERRRAIDTLAAG